MLGSEKNITKKKKKKSKSKEETKEERQKEINVWHKGRSNEFYRLARRSLATNKSCLLHKGDAKWKIWTTQLLCQMKRKKMYRKQITVEKNMQNGHDGNSHWMELCGHVKRSKGKIYHRQVFFIFLFLKSGKIYKLLLSNFFCFYVSFHFIYIYIYIYIYILYIYIYMCVCVCVCVCVVCVCGYVYIYQPIHKCRMRHKVNL